MSNAGYIRSGLLQRGLPGHVADAFIVNFRDESGLNPGINEAKPLVPGSRGGFGLYQLTGPRRREYEAFASRRGVQPSDVDAQLDFLMGELQGSERRAGQRILSAPDTATAAQAIVNDFLRPAASHRAKRSARYASLGGGASAYNAEPQPSGATSAIDSILGTNSTLQGPMAYGGDTVAQGGRMGGLGGLGGFTPPSQEVGLDTGAILRALGAGLIAGDASAVPAYLQQAIADQQRNVDRDYEREWQQYAFRTGLEDNELTRQQQREQVDYTRSQDAITNDYRERQLAASMLPKPEAPTALMQNLAAAGLQPGSPEYQQAVLAGTQGGTNVTLNTGEGGKFYDTLDTEQAKTFSALSEEGVRGRGKLAQIDTLEGLLNQAQTGGWAVLKQAAGEYGINTEGLSDIQSAQALINELVPQQRQPGSGPMSDSDLALFKQSLPRLINQPGGNQTIINTMRGITRYQVQMGEIADAVADRALTPAQAREQIRNLANPLEGFRSPSERQPADTTPREGGVPVGGQTPVMAGAGVPAEANGTMPMIQTQEQFDALPSGATFVAPDGNIRRKP